MRLKFKYKIWLAGILFLLFLLGSVLLSIAFARQQIASDSQLAVLIPDEEKIYKATQALTVEPELWEKFDLVTDFSSGNLIYFQDGKYWYGYVTYEGKLVNQFPLNEVSDPLWAARRLLFSHAGKVYFLQMYNFSVRLIVIDPIAQTYTTTSLQAGGQIVFYDDFQIFVSGASIFVPLGSQDGSTSLLRVNMIDQTLKKIGFDSSACGAGKWDLMSNTGPVLVFNPVPNAANSSRCVYDMSLKRAYLVDTKVNLNWYRAVPQKGWLVAEEFKLVGGNPDTSGKLAIYDYENNRLVAEVDMAGDKLFATEQATSPGGLSLAHSYYLTSDSLYLTPRGYSKFSVIELKLDNSSTAKLVATKELRFDMSYIIHSNID